jgi:hypothetical protein
MTHQFDADASFLRSARSGRNYDAFRTHRLNLSDAHFIVPANLNSRAQFTQVLDQVVSKRIVVIEDEDHRSIVASTWSVQCSANRKVLILCSAPHRHPRIRPGGAAENSPALQRREKEQEMVPVPEGRLISPANALPL